MDVDGRFVELTLSGQVAHELAQGVLGCKQPNKVGSRLGEPTGASAVEAGAKGSGEERRISAVDSSGVEISGSADFFVKVKFVLGPCLGGSRPGAGRSAGEGQGCRAWQ